MAWCEDEHHWEPLGTQDSNILRCLKCRGLVGSGYIRGWFPNWEWTNNPQDPAIQAVVNYYNAKETVRVFSETREESLPCPKCGADMKDRVIFKSEAPYAECPDCHEGLDRLQKA